MKVILTQDVKSQGKKGQLINVSDGYARNFLLPKKLAVEATTDNMNTMRLQEKAKQAQIEREKAEANATAMNDLKNKESSRLHKIELEKQAANDIAKKLESITVKLQEKAGADGRLYGSVTSLDIANALDEQHKIQVDKRKIQLSEPLKTFGVHTVTVKLYTEITGKINVVISDVK